MKRQWSEWSWEDFRNADMSATIAVLPVAAVEQHGPHLPLGVDSFIMEGYLARVHERLPDDLPVLFLPTQWVGASREHIAFPGTLTLSPQTALAAWLEIAESVYRTGCRKIVLINSHGGNLAIVDTLARELRVRFDMLAVTTFWHRFGYPDDLFDANEHRFGIHGGDIETSLMLAFRPDLVRRELLRDFPSANIAMEQDFNWLRSGSPTGFGWMAQDLNASGAIGNAALATREKGEACADYGATAFVELLQDVEEFDLARLDNSPI